MKLKNISQPPRTIDVVCPFAQGGIKTPAGESSDFHKATAADLLASFPSDWEAVDIKPTKKKES